MKKIFVTGASGFIGNPLCKTLSNSNFFVRGSIRSDDLFLTNNQIEYVSVGNINHQTYWKDILNGIDCIIHCAGRAHRMNENRNSNEYYLMNTESTKNLAEQAAEAGVKRLIFLSSIKVNGEFTNKIGSKHKFFFNDIPNAKDVYAKSKLEAEKILFEISSRLGLEVVVIRLPLTYGNNVKGNLARLIKIIRQNFPLPLSMIENQRSMIGVDNLIDLLICCIDHPKANGKIFLASDGKDLSTSDLIKLIASSMGRKANLFPLPIFILKFLGLIFKRREEINRLIGSLRIDNSYTKETLNWTPPISVEEGIRRMVQGK
jgi:nucleoside-diphosphate-sugar epimerase